MIPVARGVAIKSLVSKMIPVPQFGNSNVD